ncbi:MAG: hypothetical protein V7K98_23990 [Nostoc sp.]|uniref:hypothetical protein n=1 Tax=Nostoc sp. TaxID=1180 RepID=UPI002FF9611D
MPLFRKVSKNTTTVNNYTTIDGVQIPATIKTASEPGDYFIGIDTNGGLYKITKADLLAGLSSDGGSGTVSGNKTLLLLHGETIADSSTYLKSLTNTDVSSVADYSKFGGKSLYFNGASRLSVSSESFASGSNDFCFEMFIRWAQTSFSGEPGIFQLSSAGDGLQAGYSNSLGIAVVPISGNPKYFMIANGNAYNGTIEVMPNSFDYIALKRETRVVSGIEKRITSLWVNGYESVSVEDNTAYSCSKLALGGYYSTGYLGRFYLDDFRVSSEAKNTSTVPTVMLT